MSGAGLLFNNQVVVIAGAGNGTGEKLAGFFASRGASVLFNDENASFADSVVTTIRKSGGKATAGSFPNAKGDKIIDRAIQTYGSIHVLINNPACRTAQHTSFKDLSDAEWDTIQKVKNIICPFGMNQTDVLLQTYVFGAYKVIPSNAACYSVRDPSFSENCEF
jgi:multifunctional beta-oxidation protein